MESLLTWTHMVDTHGRVSVSHFPEEDSKLRATECSARRGGNCPNSLEVLQQILALENSRSSRRSSSHSNDRDGITTIYLVSTLPARESPPTHQILSSLAGHSGLTSFEHCIFREGHAEAASSYIIHSRATGSRTIVNYNGLPEMTTDELMAVAKALQMEGEDCWWHFEVNRQHIGDSDGKTADGVFLGNSGANTRDDTRLHQTITRDPTLLEDQRRSREAWARRAARTCV